MKNYSLIIWDFNGTLLDDVGAALGSVNDMLARRSKEPITLDEYREYIDVPIRHFYEQVLDLENEDYDLILNEFQQGYEAHVKNCGLTRFGSRRGKAPRHSAGSALVERAEPARTAFEAL